MPNKPEVALIDADILTYRLGFAVEKKKYSIVYNGETISFESKALLNKWPKEHGIKEEEVEVTTIHTVEPLSHALYLVNQVITGILEKLGVSKYEVYLSGSTCFRDQVAITKPYKGNRDPAHKPRWYKQIREYLQTQYGSVVTGEIEADDALGIAQGSYSDRSCIVSNDKDLRQIPGWNFNPFGDSTEPSWITPRDADLQFYTQLLTGDDTDNIPGIDGVGPVAASKLLAGVKSSKDAERIAWKRYKLAYPGASEEGKEGVSQHAVDRFLETGRLVRIRRGVDEGLWQPQIELN